MTVLPENPWLNRTYENILNELLTDAPAGIDKSVGSFMYDMLAPVAASIHDAYLKADLLRRVAFVDTAYGAYLDARVEEHGLVRRAAISSVGTIRVTGQQGTSVPSGSQFSTLVDFNSGKAALVFYTTAIARIQPRKGTGTWQESDESITYVGTWNTDATTKFSVIVNDTAKIFFNGTNITIRVKKGTDKGKVGWRLDGGGETIVDLYNAGGPLDFDIVIGPVSADNHDITLRVETKNASSSANNVNIDYYTVTGGATTITDFVDIAIAALNPGQEGNVGSGTIVRLASPLNNITTVTNPAALTGGTDSETDAALKARFKVYVANPPSSGNKADYIRWAKEADVRVGNADVQPLWAGPGTVKVFVVDTDNMPASAPIVAAVQAYIDPAVSGLGTGKAPIGAAVTVGTPVSVPIDVNVTVTYAAAYDPASVRIAIIANMKAYINSLAIADTVRFSGLANAIHDTAGVQDYSALQFRRDVVAFAATNITLAAGEKAALDAVVIT